MEIKLELTPEIEDIIKPSQTIPYDGTEWGRKYMTKVAALISAVAKAAHDAKEEEKPVLPGALSPNLLTRCSEEQIIKEYYHLLNQIIKYLKAKEAADDRP